MKLGLVREDGTGPTKESQRDKLREAGVDTSNPNTLYEDVLRQKKGKPPPEPSALKQRFDLLRILRPGDVVVVASPSRLGMGRQDTTGVLRAVTDAGASVLDASTGQTVVMQPEAETAWSFVDRAEGERLAFQLQEMRQQKVAMGATGGRPTRLTAKRKTEARKTWADLTLTAAQAAAKVGVSVRTMYRLFGNRGVPTLPESSQ